MDVAEAEQGEVLEDLAAETAATVRAGASSADVPSADDEDLDVLADEGFDLLRHEHREMTEEGATRA